MYTCMALCITAIIFGTVFLCVAILRLQTLPYQNRVVAIFPLACMAAISNLKWLIYIQRSKNQLTPIKLKSVSSCSSDHMDSKNVWFARCPKFRNGVMG